MSVIKRELYEALVSANVDKELAAKAAELDSTQANDIHSIKVEVAEIKAKVSNIDRLLWVVVAGVIGLVIKGYLIP